MAGTALVGTALLGTALVGTALAPIAGDLGTKAMERVSTGMYEHESARDRERVRMQSARGRRTASPRRRRLPCSA
jgi:hypothetical protein